MTEREQAIRELIARLAKPESGVSREFSILSEDNAEFLLSELTRERDEAPAVTLSRSEVAEVLKLTQDNFKALPDSIWLKLKGTGA